MKNKAGGFYLKFEYANDISDDYEDSYKFPVPAISRSVNSSKEAIEKMNQARVVGTSGKYISGGKMAKTGQNARICHRTLCVSPL